MTADAHWRSDLERWLEPFLAGLSHPARRKMCPLYVAGLIGPGDRKSVQPMAARSGEAGYDQLHHFVSAGVWDSAPLEAALLKEADRLVGDENGFLVIDDTALPKKGDHSVRLAPQYASSLGKTANCHSMVSVTLASREVPLMVGLRLFLPEGWTDDPESGIIVQTGSARNTLISRGFAAERITAIPHGPLDLIKVVAPTVPKAQSAGAPWRVTFFGKIQRYKGVYVLVEALGLMSSEDRSKFRLVVAGEPLYPVEPILQRVAELSLQDIIEFRLKRQSEQEMAALFTDTDAFVFPYRQIEASGVFYLVMGYGCWIIASKLGAFKDAITDGRNGALADPDDPRALSNALLASVGKRPDPLLAETATSWSEIGLRTRAVYDDAIANAGAKR